MVGTNIRAIPASLRRANERTMLGLLMRLGTASRAHLAKAAGISQPTAGKITNKLLARGILQELDEGALVRPGGVPPGPQVGRPGRLLRIDSEKPRFIAIELDVAQTRVAALPVAIVSESFWAASFPTPASPADWERKLREVSRRLPSGDFWGLLVSVPGIVDETGGRVLFSPNLHWSERVGLPNILEQIWPLPVLVVQEIRALALGHLAANPEVQDFLLVDFGEGVGGAIVERGRLRTPTLPFNGELGHTPVLWNQRLCGCGARGCLETLVSRRGLLESHAATNAGSQDGWDDLCQSVRQKGIPPWLAKTLEATGATIAGALNVLGLSRVVITGCLAELPASVIDCLATVVNQGAMWARFGQVSCEFAPRRRLAGLATVGLDRLLFPLALKEGSRARAENSALATQRKD